MANGLCLEEYLGVVDADSEYEWPGEYGQEEESGGEYEEGSDEETYEEIEEEPEEESDE